MSFCIHPNVTPFPSHIPHDIFALRPLVSDAIPFVPPYPSMFPDFDSPNLHKSLIFPNSVFRIAVASENVLVVLVLMDQ